MTPQSGSWFLPEGRATKRPDLAVPVRSSWFSSSSTLAEKTRNDLLAHLQNLNPTEFADTLRHLSRTTLEYTH
ncbi:hypothetical protein [Micromonospora sp. MW-13]|uniref:hypothetical protein n=1 Tax=Micromonospora sp. MW-13 TaxID=2094022 RepID=UPI0014045CF4|nr:hypothetical protein [Micromonospora sp. MW-13]